MFRRGRFGNYDIGSCTSCGHEPACLRERGDGKVPAIAWRGYQMRLPTPQEVLAWFGAEPMNLAVITGALSSNVVIDVDDLASVCWLTRRLPTRRGKRKRREGFIFTTARLLRASPWRVV